MAFPNYSKSIHPVFDASAGVTGFPTTIFFAGIPFFIISLTEVPLKNPPD